jgi:catechol 2,3-dioxygenase-like lactoylglutathione lyase family enzyme
MIQHVSLECRRDEGDAHRRFWRALGAEEITPPESLRDRAAWLQLGTSQIHLLWADEPVVPPEGHIALHVPDLERALSALSEANFALERRAQHWGAPRAYAHGPGGHIVELFDRAPQSQS